MNNPLISVIIPAHNSEKTIAGAIQSIQNQTYRNLEIIVVDDNSADDTKEVVERIAKADPRVKFFSIPFDDPNRFNKRGKNINAGYMARNYGFEQVRGEWITFQDADDASLLNRIEVQYNLAKRYQATHVCIDWQQFNPSYLDKKLDADKIFVEHSDIVAAPQEISALAKKTKGVIIPFLGTQGHLIPFEWKRLPVVNKLFFRSLAPYPGTGNSPLFKREVIERVAFRPLAERVWPSFMGRGADRDFNFQVAETFNNSYTFFIPLYLWRQKSQNERYADYGKYLY
ncbi:MAG: Glycosyl transferase family 2 [Parcubacteria group bacterium GW2011_GWA1_47_8]|nr:MAG: Glycosyl transferase family 2 [Parcubacteria group bacterium GW2011_GWA1_47_8]